MCHRERSEVDASNKHQPPAVVGCARTYCTVRGNCTHSWRVKKNFQQLEDQSIWFSGLSVLACARERLCNLDKVVHKRLCFRSGIGCEIWTTQRPLGEKNIICQFRVQDWLIWKWITWQRKCIVVHMFVTIFSTVETRTMWYNPVSNRSEFWYQVFCLVWQEEHRNDMNTTKWLIWLRSLIPNNSSLQS